ncbi:MAG: hypothetical protein R3B58_08525 [Phycisphaerales bacterium]|nr:hypothetical protein [Phycisphaerales bacterium]
MMMIDLPMLLVAAVFGFLCYIGAGTMEHERAKARSDAGRCSRCGYDLHGLPDNTLCPECGADEALRQALLADRVAARVPPGFVWMFLACWAVAVAMHTCVLFPVLNTVNVFAFVLLLPMLASVVFVLHLPVLLVARRSGSGSDLRPVIWLGVGSFAVDFTTLPAFFADSMDANQVYMYSTLVSPCVGGFALLVLAVGERVLFSRDDTQERSA